MAKKWLKRNIMADFTVIGYINNIKYLQDSCLVFLDEFRKGFRKKDGTIVDDKYISWKCIFKPYFKKYINEQFNQGMLVQVKGEIMPYAIEKGHLVDGYSVIGQTINVASYPRASVKQEAKMIKDSQMHASETPDLEGFNAPDF